MAGQAKFSIVETVDNEPEPMVEELTANPEREIKEGDLDQEQEMQKIGKKLMDETYEKVRDSYNNDLRNEFIEKEKDLYSNDFSIKTNKDKARKIDPYGQLTHDRFLKVFHKPPIKDPKEKKKRAIILKKNQKEVLKNNKAYLAGDVTWLENTNEFSDITEEDFRSSMLGFLDNNNHPADRESERFYRSSYYSKDRTCLPSSYNSVSRGYISPVKNQRIPDDPRQYGCGSCVAFATLALLETCFKRKVGKFGDYSEQHLLDCAYGWPNDKPEIDMNITEVGGCIGAEFSGYARWLRATRPKLAAESDYPYVAYVETCRTDYKELYQGVRMKDIYYTDKGNEEMLKKLVVEHGAVVSSIAIDPDIYNKWLGYESGIWTQQTNKPYNHVVVVVGYGTENGIDYWLVKNSWGKNWGMDGFMKIQRGVNMCGIGRKMVTITCGFKC